VGPTGPVGIGVGDVSGKKIFLVEGTMTPFRDCARGFNNRAQMCALLSAIDVTARTLFERLYLVPGLREIAP